MPTLDGKKYSYDKEGKSKYLKALKKKRKKKKLETANTSDYDNQWQNLHNPPGGDTP